ncbi:unnamed protein product, partial [Effrenium voratum]
MSHPAILYWERQRRERHRPRQPLRHADSAPMLPAIHAAHDLRFPSLPPAVHRREATRLGEKLREATQARMASQVVIAQMEKRLIAADAVHQASQDYSLARSAQQLPMACAVPPSARAMPYEPG